MSICRLAEINSTQVTAGEQSRESRIQNYAVRLAFFILLAGCTSKDQSGAPGIAGPGGAATTEVAGLKIEVEPTGSDGAAGATINSEEEGIHRIAMGGVTIVLEHRDSGDLLRLAVEGKEYGQVQQGDHLRIDRSREVFLNDQLIKPETAEVGNSIPTRPNDGQ